MYLCISDFSAANNYKYYDLEIEATKYPKEKTSDAQNTHKEKFVACEITTKA